MAEEIKYYDVVYTGNQEHLVCGTIGGKPVKGKVYTVSEKVWNVNAGGDFKLAPKKTAKKPAKKKPAKKTN